MSDSENETINETASTRSSRGSITNKKQKTRYQNRSNCSHTTYFFRVESDIAYCKVCETNFTGTNKSAYGYSRKGGNTTNLISHLRDKHNITKNNYFEFFDEQEEVFFLIFFLYCNANDQHF